MKKRNAVSRGSRLAIVLSVMLAAPGAAMAVEEHHAGEQAGASEAKPMQPEQMMKMQEHMLKMHEQMHKIMAAKKPADRERLMQEQRQMMQEHMKAMHGQCGMMGGGMMMDCGKMGGGMQRPMDGTGKNTPPPVK
jgi:hypothetical protein